MTRQRFETIHAYRKALAWLADESTKSYPDWDKIDRIHKKLPKIWHRWMRIAGYI